MKMKNRLSLIAGLAFAALMCAAAPASAQFNAFKEPQAASSGGSVSGPDLKATADKFEGGKVTVGATAYVVATFVNNGSSPVKVTGINLYPSSTVSANVNLNKCADAALPPEAVCAITIAITGLQVGSWRVEVLVDHDGRTRLATAALGGEIAGSTAESGDQVKAEVEIIPAEMDFGTAGGGVPMVRALLLRNRTSEKVSLTDIKLDAPEQSGFSFKSECPDNLNPGETCVVNMTWVPIARGLSQGVLRVNHSAKSSITKVDVKGTFAPDAGAAATLYPDAAPDMGLLVSDMDRVDFGTGINSIASITLSLVNRGSANLTLKSIGLAGSDNGIGLSRSGCRAGLPLKPSDACLLTVNWVPSRAGAVLDDLQIRHTGVRGVLVLPIRGTADAAATRGTIPMRQGSSVFSPDDIGAELAADGSTEKPSMPENAYTSSASGITPVLDGYIVTSHSPTKAVINGPVGSLVVRDGEDVVVSGVRWTVTIVSTGVILSSESDEMLLVFDHALKPIGNLPTATTSSTTSATSSNGTSSSSDGASSSTSP